MHYDDSENSLGGRFVWAHSVSECAVPKSGRARLGREEVKLQSVTNSSNVGVYLEAGLTRQCNFATSGFPQGKWSMDLKNDTGVFRKALTGYAQTENSKK